jgi:long-chain acyl-CoA synthetase
MRGTIGGLLLRSFRDHTERVAWHIHNTSEPGVESITYAELGERSLDAAGGFATLGLARGDVVGIIAAPSSERMLAEIGCLLAGLQPLNLPPDLPPAQVSRLLREAGARALVTAPAQRTAIADSEPALPTVMLSNGARQHHPELAPGPSDQLMAGLLERGHAFRRSESGRRALDERLAAAPPNSPAIRTVSAGSAGTARLMTLTHAVVTHQVNSLPTAVHLTPHDLVLAPARPWHAFHQLCSWSALAAGASLGWYVTDAVPSLPRTLAAIRPTMAILDSADLDTLLGMARAPTRNRGLLSEGIHSLLVNAGQLRWHAHRDARGLCRVTGRVGALQRGLMRTSGLLRLALLHQPARLASREIFTPLRERLGNRLRTILTWGTPSTLVQDSLLGEAGVEVLEAYGLLEVAPVVAIRRAGRAVSQTVGPPLPGLDLKVVDSRHRPCACGQVGELLIRGPARQAEQSAAAQVSQPDTWRRSGDHALITEAGDLVILDRHKPASKPSRGTP